ncbi:MAG: 23S rRNA (adenine(2503)-C(2))-methyltransferase RlmN [bacterium]|nr:23S rRNA (adenine(2503)-C(2))-methyltransferase RlmN [bacterium]
MDLRGVAREELAAWLEVLGEPGYRARQILHWIYRRGVTDPLAMTDLPASLRQELAARIRPPEAVLAHRAGPDGTLKLLLGFEGDVAVECVRLRYGYGYTACVSSQAGCAMGCAFCRSGEGGLGRNLTAGEMVAQVLALRGQGGHRGITRVVVMGSGEPLANYEELSRFLRLCVDPDGFGISPRRLTVSTCGLVPGMRRLADDGPAVTLSVSLHAAHDELRDRLVPVNRRWPLAALLEACRYYRARTGRRVTAEYVLIEGLNDRPEDTDRLARLVRGAVGHVNLIPLNPVPGTRHRPSPPEAVTAFARRLRAGGLPATVRRSLGRGVDGACGQLRASFPARTAGTGGPDDEPGPGVQTRLGREGCHAGGD